MVKNFLIVGTQRTGSTALFRALNFHPDIACGSEWTQDVPAHRKFQVTERALKGDFSVLSALQRKRIEQVFKPEKHWLGFKLLFRSSGKWLIHPRFAPALWLDRFDAYLNWLARRPGLHVIHITRKDPVEWLKSKYLSDAVQAWAGKPYPADLKITVPIAEALKRLATKNWVDNRLSGLDATNPYLRVSYEDFLASDREIVSRLLNFLRVDPARLSEFDYRQHTKQSHRPASQYISNFTALTAELRRRGILSMTQA